MRRHNNKHCLMMMKMTKKMGRMKMKEVEDDGDGDGDSVSNNNNNNNSNKERLRWQKTRRVSLIYFHSAKEKTVIGQRPNKLTNFKFSI